MAVLRLDSAHHARAFHAGESGQGELYGWAPRAQGLLYTPPAAFTWASTPWPARFLTPTVFFARKRQCRRWMVHRDCCMLNETGRPDAQ